MRAPEGLFIGFFLSIIRKTAACSPGCIHTWRAPNAHLSRRRGGPNVCKLLLKDGFLAIRCCVIIIISSAWAECWKENKKQLSKHHPSQAAPAAVKTANSEGSEKWNLLKWIRPAVRSIDHNNITKGKLSAHTEVWFISQISLWLDEKSPPSGAPSQLEPILFILLCYSNRGRGSSVFMLIIMLSHSFSTKHTHTQSTN